MSQTRLTFALFGNIYQHEKSAAVRQVLACLEERGANILIEEEYYDFLRCSELIDADCIETFNDSSFEADFAISMGGDGTLLKTASQVREKQIPILGVNMGRLGFLADVSAKDFPQTIDALYHGDYSVENRALIRVESNGEPIDGYPFALNDVAILKRDTASMITIRTLINGEYLIFAFFTLKRFLIVPIKPPLYSNSATRW